MISTNIVEESKSIVKKNIYAKIPIIIIIIKMNNFNVTIRIKCYVPECSYLQ